MCRSSGGNANARAVETEPAEPGEEREIQHVWALSVCDISGLPSDALSVCDNSDIPTDESGNQVNMIMDSGVGKRDFLPIRVGKSREINAMTFSIMKREVQSVNSELRALRAGHLSTSEVNTSLDT